MVINHVVSIGDHFLMRLTRITLLSKTVPLRLPLGSITTLNMAMYPPSGARHVTMMQKTTL